MITLLKFVTPAIDRIKISFYIQNNSLQEYREMYNFLLSFNMGYKYGVFLHI